MTANPFQKVFIGKQLIRVWWIQLNEYEANIFRWNNFISLIVANSDWKGRLEQISKFRHNNP